MRENIEYDVARSIKRYGMLGSKGLGGGWKHWEKGSRKMQLAREEDLSVHERKSSK